MSEVLSMIHRKLVVSCQALEHEPLYGAAIMGQMAVAAMEGGASGIRANSPADIRAIKAKVNAPIIGLYKKDFDDSEVYITPTIDEVRAVVEAGADIVAFDATDRVRPNGITYKQFIEQVRAEFPKVLLMADISTFEEGVLAEEYGVDMVSTTLAGYTPYSEQKEGFNFDLLKALLAKLTIPVIAEGKIYSPSEAAECLRQGAYSVVVGSAITRPQEITKMYAKQVRLVSEEA